MDLDQVMRVAVRAAYRAGEQLRLRQGRLTTVDKKGPNDLVTDADLASEGEIVAAIRASFPEHAIIAEEGGIHGRPSELRWLVDPLDGTVNFAHQVPFFAVSIAFALGDAVQAGVVLNPVSGELFTACAGQGARLNGQPVRVNPEARIGESLLATGFPYDRTQGFQATAERFLRCLKAARGIRRLGSAALDLCFVACGRFGGYWENQLQPWDLAAGALIVREAGGITTDYSGRPLDAGSREVVAANGQLHPGLLSLMEV
jgi:myo-inositol-1(or 4)-monophosphatase